MTRLALVTAGTSAIGRHLVAALADNGYHVAYTHLPGEAPTETETTRPFTSDAADEAQVTAFHTAAMEWAETAPSVMVNNAGIQTWAPLLDLKTADWDRVIATNLRGLFLNTQATARAMIAAGIKGNIITLGSGCNRLAFPRLVDYTTSKGGVEQFTKVAASELGPHGIRVNCIAPRRHRDRPHPRRGSRLCRYLVAPDPAAPDRHSAGPDRAVAVPDLRRRKLRDRPDDLGRRRGLFASTLALSDLKHQRQLWPRIPAQGRKACKCMHR